MPEPRLVNANDETQQVPGEAAEKIEAERQADPAQLFEDFFPVETSQRRNLVRNEWREKHDFLSDDWDTIQVALFVECIDEDVALERAKVSIQHSNYPELDPNELISVLKDYDEALKGAEDEIYKQGTETTNEMLYSRAKMLLETSGSPEEYHYRQSVYKLAIKYMTSEDITRAEELAYESEVYRMENSSAAIAADAADRILDAGKHYPNSLREDQTARNALQVRVNHWTDKMSETAERAFTYRVKRLANRIHEWREIWTSSEQNDLEHLSIPLSGVEAARFRQALIESAGEEEEIIESLQASGILSTGDNSYDRL